MEKHISTHVAAEGTGYLPGNPSCRYEVTDELNDPVSLLNKKELMKLYEELKHKKCREYKHQHETLLDKTKAVSHVK